MLISFLMPYNVKYAHAPFLWVFYKQINCFKNNEIIYVGSKDYFVKPSLFPSDKWELSESVTKGLEYQVPSDFDVETVKKYEIDELIFTKLENELHGNNLIFKHLLLNRYEPLEIELDNIFSNIIKQTPIEAIITWCNVPSLNYVAQKYRIKVIHNELGPLRKPYYRYTAYFDFSGVNGHTEAQVRYRQFYLELKKNKELQLEILDRETLLSFFLSENYYHYLNKDDSNNFEIGIPLQVEDDSNILAFSNGFNNFELIRFTGKYFPDNMILIREHPSGYMEYNKPFFGNKDHSQNSIEFIKRCKRLVTINSSVGLEAALFGKIVYILGDSPASMVTYNELDIQNENKLIENIAEKLNYFLFGYLMPYELLFNIDYYRWRLTEPSELEVYTFHRNFYLSKFEEIQNESLRKVICQKIIRQLQSMQNSISEKDIQVQTMQNDISEKDIQLQSMQNDILEKGAQLQRLQEEISCCTMEMSRIDKENKKKDEENRVLIQQREELHKLLNDQRNSFIQQKNIISELQRNNEVLMQDLRVHQIKIDSLTRELERITNLEKMYQNEINSLINSTSWRITGPLRKISSIILRKS